MPSPEDCDTYNCVTRRQHFNYLRNNSCSMSAAFTWGNQNDGLQDQQIDMTRSGGHKEKEQSKVDSKRRVSFDEKKKAQRQNSIAKQQKNVLHETNKRKQMPTSQNFQRKSKLQKDYEGQKLAQEERRQKVMNYIQEQRPYTRTLTNSKFQQYYQKAAPECYGRANTNEPIGGIIYGNHQKTFNKNPHSYTNNPEYYQTHTTALNFGKRTKLCEEEHWKRLERQLSKKLGLKDKNETLKQGKQVVYVDVDDTNMYQALKENHEFQKQNKEEIHSRELEYKKEKHKEHLDEINEFYAKKGDIISKNASQKLQTTMNTDLDPEEYQTKLNQQVIYRHHDEDGNIRYGADRHALTCFVDLNFPENDQIYTEQLKKRLPIYPIKCKEQDRNIDPIRRQNCQKRKSEVYPSHYMLRNCEEPEVIKMLSQKSGIPMSGRKTNNEKHLSNSHRNPRAKSAVLNKSACTGKSPFAH